MIWISFIWFTILYGAGYFLSPDKDIFGPVRFATLKLAVFNLPFILFTAIYPKTFLRGILTVCNTNVYDAFYTYTLMQSLAYISLLAGILLFKGRNPIADINITRLKTLQLQLYTATIVIVAMAAYGLFLYRVGGLGYLLENLHKRVALQGGQYVLVLLEVLPLAAMTLLLLFKKEVKKIYLWLAVLSLIVFSLVLTSFGARQPTMILVATAVIAWHYYIKPIKLNRKTVFFGSVATVLFAFYLLLVPFIRMNVQQKQDLKWTEKKAFTVRTFMYNLSYVYIDVLIANYFTPDNAWYMDGYFDSVKAFGYKGDKGNLPQVDQGVYLKSIYMYQKDFRPPMPRKDVSATSWPTENLGFAMANFGWYGIVPCFFLLGIVYSGAYRFMRKYIVSPVALMFYVQVIIQFNFSSLRVSFFVKTLLLFYVCFVVFNKFVVDKNHTDA